MATLGKPRRKAGVPFSFHFLSPFGPFRCFSLEKRPSHFRCHFLQLALLHVPLPIKFSNYPKNFLNIVPAAQRGRQKYVSITALCRACQLKREFGVALAADFATRRQSLSVCKHRNVNYSKRRILHYSRNRGISTQVGPNGLGLN